MTPDPQRRRQTIIPPLESEDEEAAPSVHRARTVIEGYEPPRPGGATARGPDGDRDGGDGGGRALYRPDAPPDRDRAPREQRAERKAAPPARGLLGLGPVADFLFLIGLSVVFAGGIGIGAALVGP